MELSDYEINSLKKLGQSLQDGQWSNHGLVQLIELAATYLNAESIPTYSKRTGMSYNGVKNYRSTVMLLGHKFVIDND